MAGLVVEVGLSVAIPILPCLAGLRWPFVLADHPF